MSARLSSWKWQRQLLPIPVFIAGALVMRLEYPLPDDAMWLMWFTRLDPLLFVSYVRAGIFPDWSWLPLGLIAATLIFGRFFCGWLCPFGGLLRMAGQLAAKLPPNRLRIVRAGGARYIWLGFLLILLLTGTNIPLLLTPFVLFSHDATLLYTGNVPWLTLLAITGGILYFPRFWCVYICPTGLFLSVFAKFRRAQLRIASGCINCGQCAIVCPSGAAMPEAGRIAEDCLICNKCREVCPEQVIQWKGAASNDNFQPSRRHFIGAVTASVLAVAVWPAAKTDSSTPLRPPGALAEPELVLRCNRCARCIKVCPNEALVPAPPSDGLAAYGTPVFVPRKARCELCMLCPEVCPTGALVKTAVEQVKIGVAKLDQSLCLAWEDNKLCLICAEQCPVQAIAIDKLHRPSVTKTKCVGCGACENACPVAKAAILVRPVAR